MPIRIEYAIVGRQRCLRIARFAGYDRNVSFFVRGPAARGHGGRGDRMTEVGVIHGRFQVLHNDHLKYLLAGKAHCRHLIVGITNPDPLLTRDDPADPARSSPLANPLTYYERYQLIRTVLLEAGLDLLSFSIVPFPINFPELYRHYVPLDAVFYLTIYDDWGRRKLEQFEAMGLTTEVLWERPSAEKGLSAEDIRRLMVCGEPWQHLVPTATATLMQQWDIAGRLRRFHGCG
jgi:nicotinamide mononucleotide adenylyltransferase